jgi:gluconokinase
MEYIIGLDIGTTTTKAIAFSPEGKVIHKESIANSIYHPFPGYSEQDPDEIFRNTLMAIQALVGAGQCRQLHLAGISMSAAMHGLMAIDQNGGLLTPLITWADQRSDTQAEQIKAKLPNLYFQTGNPIHPMLPLCKILWIRENLADIFQHTHKFISIKEYVLYRLFGEYLIDYAVASSTGLFNIHHLNWDSQALEVAQITPLQLSVPVSGKHTLTGITKGYDKVMHIPPNTPFIVGGADGCLACLGSGIGQPQEASLTIGTSGAVRVKTDKLILDNQQRHFTYLLDAKSYIVGGATNNGGIIYQWLKERFTCHTHPAKEPYQAYQQLDALAGQIPEGSEGMICLPYLLGERAPVWDARARGAFFGINITHTQAHFIRSAMEGIIFNLYTILKIIEENPNLTINHIFASGGFVQSKLWVKMVSDVFNKKVILSKSHDASARGAAIVGWEALGCPTTFLPASETTIYPDAQKHECYMKTFNVYQGLYNKLKELFPKLQELENQ